MKYVLLHNSHKKTATEIMQTGDSSETSSDRSIIYVCVLQDAYHKLFCVFGDFYVSETQDAEVTKSLLYQII